MKLESQHELTRTGGTRQEPTYMTWTHLLNALHHSTTLRAFEPGFALAKDVESGRAQHWVHHGTIQYHVEFRNISAPMHGNLPKI